MSKTGERKEKDATPLVEGLESAYEGLKKGPSSSTLFWLGGIVAIALIAFAFWWFWRSSTSVASQRWAELTSIAFPAQLADFLEKSELKDTPQGRLARFEQARADLAVGMRNLADRTGSEAAREQIAKAVTTYEELLGVANLLPTLQQEAILGAARGHEALGDWDKAKTLYAKLIDNHEDSPLAKEARDHLARLESSKGERTRLQDTFKGK